MFCTNCGTQNPDEAVTCSNCGASMGGSKNETKSFDVSSMVQKARSSKYFLPAVAGVAVVLVLILAISLFGGGSKVKPVESLFKGIVTGDTELFLSCVPADFIEYYDEELGVDLEDRIDDSIDDMVDEAEDEFGENLKVKVKVTDKEKLDEDDLKDLASELKDNYDLSKRDVKEAWELECEIFISGDDDEDSEDLDVTVFKYQGKWYINPSDFFGAW